MSVNVQYVGFTAKFPGAGTIDRLSRDYLHDSERGIYVPPFEPAEWTGHLLAQTHRELADSSNGPLKTHYRISETELDAYRDSHTSGAAKTKKGLATSPAPAPSARVF